MEFSTGLDALLINTGDFVNVTDEKYNFALSSGEVVQIQKIFDEEPKIIFMRIRRDDDIDVIWGFLGSNVDESDGISPQAADWDSATDVDKQFIYLSQTGGGGPDYRMF